LFFLATARFLTKSLKKSWVPAPLMIFLGTSRSLESFAGREVDRACLMTLWLFFESWVFSSLSAIVSGRKRDGCRCRMARVGSGVRDINPERRIRGEAAL